LTGISSFRAACVCPIDNASVTACALGKARFNRLPDSTKSTAKKWDDGPFSIGVQCE
jgi:hypothetical protein